MTDKEFNGTQDEDHSGTDAWFRQEVERAVQEADKPNAEWDSQAEVQRQSAIKRAAWRSKSISSAKAGV